MNHSVFVVRASDRIPALLGSPSHEGTYDLDSHQVFASSLDLALCQVIMMEDPFQQKIQLPPRSSLWDEGLYV